MAKRNLATLPTPAQLREVYEYDPDTGLFRHKPRSVPFFGWRYADRPAGSLSKQTGYVNLKYMHRSIRAHQAAWAMVYGEWPADQLDHINGDRTDNRIANLRPASHTQNLWNRAPMKNRGARLRGVYPHHNRWRASISHNNKRVHLGLFLTPEAAHEAFCEAAKRLRGDFARTD